MRDLYARLVLFLIRPALKLREGQLRANPEELAAALDKIDGSISPSLFSEIERS